MKKQLLLYALLFCGYAVPAWAEYTNTVSAEYNNDEYTANGAAFSAIGLDKAYTGSDGNAYTGFSGQGVTVALVDSGTFADHIDLVNQLSALYNSEFNQYSSSHGTHTAGIIAAKKNDVGMHGVAYNAALFPFAVYLTDGCEDSSNCLKWSTSWETLLEDEYDEVKIINNSWGIDELSDEQMQERVSIVQKLAAKDKLIIASAGNETALAPNAFPAGIAAQDSSLKSNLISVVAYDASKLPSDKNFISSFSNLASGAQEWTIAAPGTFYSTILYDTETETPAYASADGTSMAAPIVSGTAALVQEAFPYMGGKQIADVLFSTAFKKDDLELSPYMIQEGSDGTRFLFFTDNTDEMTYEEAVNEAGIDCSQATCSSVTFEDVFGQGLVNAGDAVKGPKYFDVQRLTSSDYDSDQEQFFYSVDTAGYDSTWSHGISEKQSVSGSTTASVGLKKKGEGTLTLSGGNTFTGVSVVEAGTLALSGSLVSGVVVDGGTFAMTGGTIDGALTVNSGGALRINGGAVNNTIVNRGTAVVVDGTAAGDVTNTGTFSVTQGTFTAGSSFSNQNVFNFAESGVFSGTLDNEATVSVIGNSQLNGTLNNASTGKMIVANTTTIDVSGTVENDGSLSGFGTIAGTVNSSAQGSAATSLSISTLNSAGNIVLTASGNEMAAMTVDTLNITGGKLTLADQNNIYRNGKTYTVIRFNTLTAFDNFEPLTYLSPFITATPMQKSNRIDMDVEYLRMTQSDSTNYFSSEERQVLGLFDRLYIDEEKEDFSLFYYYGGENLREQVNILRSKVRPVQTEKLPLTKVMASQVHAHLFSNMMTRDAAAVHQPYVPMQQYQGKYYRGRSGGDMAQNQKIWGQMLGGWTTEDGDSAVNQGDIKTKTIGAMIGYDYEVSDRLLIGLTTGMASASLRQDGNEINLKDYRAGIYTGSRYGAVTLNTLLMGGVQQYKSSRYQQVAGYDTVSIGKFNGYSAEFDVNLGYDFMRLPYRDHSFYLRSYLSANVNYIHQEAYEEKGSSFMALGVNALNNTSVSVSPGLTLGYTFAQAVLTADIGYQRILSGESIHSSAYFLADTAKETFSSLSADTDKDYFNAGLGLKTNLTRNLQAHFWAGTRLSKNTETLNLSLSLAYLF
ncbi:MAG: S8 family serine peptidase [Alphaproteobacteria bacterium]|nr:S8 family serine peptidase [Alphaproteobacteria bacterium]